jgi:hypothetical protein
MRLFMLALPVACALVASSAEAQGRKTVRSHDFLLAESPLSEALLAEDADPALLADLEAAEVCGADEACLASIVRFGAVSATSLEAMKSKLDSLSEMGEMESLRLQMAMDRLSKLMSTLSNILKKFSDTQQTITANLK